MAGFRQVPHELWFREQRRYPWIAQFLCEVSYDEHRLGSPKPTRFYAAKFEVGRQVIRRLLAARAAELGLVRPESDQPNANPAATQRQPEPDRNINRMEDRPTQVEPSPNPPPDPSLETETETETRREEPPCSPPRRGPTEFPAEDSDEFAALGAAVLAWARDPTAAHAGFDASQVAFAIASVREWALSNGKRKANWLAAVQGAMRRGWALEGFGASPTGERLSPAQQRQRRTQEAAVRVLARYDRQRGDAPDLHLIGGGAAP